MPSCNVPSDDLAWRYSPIMLDRSAPQTIFSILSVALLFGIGGCSDQGDLGRHSPSLLSKTYTSSLVRAKEFLGEDHYELPLTAAEDALRSRTGDIQSVTSGGVISQIVRPLSGDGYSYVAAIIQDLKVDRQRFDGFTQAARKVMQIDDARAERLSGLDAITARRQRALVEKRRGRNDLLIRNGVRAMRLRSDDYQKNLKQLPIEYPDVPLEEIEEAFELLHEDVVRFHGEIDQHAHQRLGKSGRASLK